MHMCTTGFKRFVRADWQERVFWGVMGAALLVNVMTLKDGHNWGDDFAQYILSALNLLDGKPFLLPDVYGVDVALPPLYSIFLLPWLKLFGLNFPLLKSLNIVLWVLEVWGVYSLVRLRCIRGLARGAAVVAATSSYFFVFKQNLLSEILFAVELLWAVLFFERYRNGGGAKFFYFFLAISLAGLLTRSAALVLYAAAIFFLLYSREKNLSWKRDSILVILSCLATLAFQKVFFGMRAGFFLQILSDPWSYIRHCLANIDQAWAGLLYVVVPGQTGLSATLFFLAAHVPYYGTVLYLLLWCIVFLRVRSGRLGFAACVFAIYMGLMFCWSWVPHSAYHFSRFLLPVYGVLLYLCAGVAAGRTRLPGMDRRGVAGVMFFILLLLNVVNITRNWHFNDDEILRPEAREMYRWVASHVSAGDEVVFMRPKALRLMTGVSAVWVRDWKSLDHRKKYIVVFNKKADPLRGLVAAISPEEIIEVWANDAFTAYRLTRFPPTLTATPR